MMLTHRDTLLLRHTHTCLHAHPASFPAWNRVRQSLIDSLKSSHWLLVENMPIRTFCQSPGGQDSTSSDQLPRMVKHMQPGHPEAYCAAVASGVIKADCFPGMFSKAAPLTMAGSQASPGMGFGAIPALSLSFSSSLFFFSLSPSSPPAKALQFKAHECVPGRGPASGQSREKRPERVPCKLI